MGSSVLTRREFVRRNAAAAAGLLSGAAALSVAQPGHARAPETSSAFAPPLGACGGPDRGPILAAAGGAFLEGGCRSILVPDQPEDVFLKKLEALQSSPVPVIAANSFLPGKLQCTGPEADHDAVLAYCDVAFARAERAGIRTITFGSSGARSLPKGARRDVAELQFVSILARMAERARDHGVTISVEPLQKRETNFIQRVSEARRLVEAVQSPAIRITADLFHMMREDEGPDAIREAGPYIHHVHVAEKEARTAPGARGDDFRPYLAALRDIGYKGGISMECRWTDFDAELPKALTSIREQLESL